MISSSTEAPVQLALLPNWLGDLVMALPALAALRQEGKLVVVGSAGALELLADAELCDGLVHYDRRGADRGPGGLWRAARRCALQHPFRAHVFPPSLRAALLAFLSGCRHRRGHPTDGRGLFLNEPVPLPDPPRSRHQADLWLEMVTGRVVEDGSAVPAYRLGPAARAGLVALRASEPRLASPGHYAVIAPAATFGPAKQWPTRHFRKLSEKLVEALGLQVVAVGGLSEDEREVARASLPEGGLNLCGSTDLPTLAALLQEAACFVGNDSGPMHLAAATGTVTLGVYGSTSPRWTAPRGRRAGHVGPHPVDCTPCFRRECPIGLPCLEELEVDEAYAALLELLESGA